MKKIGAVVVTYNNTAMLNNLLEDLYSQTRLLDEIIIIDNSDSDESKKTVASKFPNAKYIRLKENQGSAGGFYEGLNVAVIKNDLIWTLDDDVRLNSNALELLLLDLERLGNVDNIGVIRSGGSNDTDGLPKEMEMYTWRGSLFIAEALKKAGFPQKKYFIYGEDLEHSIRLKKNGFSLFWAPSSKIREARDGKANHLVFGKTLKIYSESFRFYYAFRNQLYIYIRYWQIEKLLKISLYTLKVIFYILFLQKYENRKKVWAIIDGVWDGLTGRLGKNIKYIPE